MKGLRLSVALTGFGMLALCPAARALLPAEPGAEGPVVTPASPAGNLLERAAALSRSSAWTGTQRVVSMTSGSAVVSQVVVAHDPSQDVLDERLLDLLEANYDLVITRTATCEGRPAHVIEARRPGMTGSAAVAARFWVDSATGMLLERDVMDGQGQLSRSTEMVGIKTVPSPVPVPDAVPKPAGEHLDDVDLAVMQRQGWLVPQTLPGELTLYDARWIDGEVLELAYSDGLSTLSLFVQKGARTSLGTGVVRQVGDASVWEAPGDPEHAVWVANGLTWTLVTEADPTTVDAVILALPHTQQHVATDDVVDRVWRGMARVGSWMNPFD